MDPEPPIPSTSDNRTRRNPERGNHWPRHISFYALEHRERVPGLPMVRLPLNYNPKDDPNRHLRLGDFPAAFAAWRNRNHDPWTEPPDPRPWPLPTDRMIWNPHPQYILDWDQPVAFEQQPVNVLPTYQRRPVTGESTLARTRRRLRRADPVPFPTPPSSSPSTTHFK